MFNHVEVELQGTKLITRTSSKSRHPIQHYITVTSHRKLRAHPYRARVLQNANSVTDCHSHYPTATSITCLLLIDQNDTQELLKSLGLLLQELQIHFVLVTTYMRSLTPLQALESTYLINMTTTAFPRMFVKLAS
jgi:hypothetical protein